MTKYLDGDSDALVRQNRAYFRLLDDLSTDPVTRVKVLTVVAENFRTLDRHLSNGEPLPKVWERRKGVDLTGSENTAEGGRPGSPEPKKGQS